MFIFLAEGIFNFKFILKNRLNNLAFEHIKFEFQDIMLISQCYEHFHKKYKTKRIARIVRLYEIARVFFISNSRSTFFHKLKTKLLTTLFLPEESFHFSRSSNLFLSAIRGRSPAPH
jgi:hypothetical protein